MKLTEEQINRYSRQIVLKEVGGIGQKKLLNSKISLIGLGALGSPVAYYLVAAGIGNLKIIDYDLVEPSNLHRQILHFTKDINRKKTEDWVDYDCILSMFHEKSHVARLTYQKYIQKNLKIQISSPVQRLKRRIILGSREFKKEVLKNQRLNKVAPQRNNDIFAKKIIKLTTQSPHWASLKVKKKKFSQATLPRNAAIYLLKKFTDLSNQQISTYFKSLKKSSICQMSRRYNYIKEKYTAIKNISASLEEEVKKLL